MTNQIHQSAYYLSGQSFGGALLSLHQHLQQHYGLEQYLGHFLLNQLIDELDQYFLLGQHAADAFCVLCEADEAVVGLGLDLRQGVVNELVELLDAVFEDDGLPAHGGGAYLFLASGGLTNNLADSSRILSLLFLKWESTTDSKSELSNAKLIFSQLRSITVTVRSPRWPGSRSSI